MTAVSGTSWGIVSALEILGGVTIFSTRLSPLSPSSHLPSLERLQVSCPSERSRRPRGQLSVTAPSRDSGMRGLPHALPCTAVVGGTPAPRG